MKKIIGITGPSKFTPELRAMVSGCFDAIPLDINQDGEDLNQVLPLCNAIILGGGVDIMPCTYGEEVLNRRGLSKFDKARDDRELAIFEWCGANKKPLLGICRGHQLILSHLGCPLMTDISHSEICHNPLNQDIDMGGHPVHFVDCEEEYKESYFEQELVNSFHHQAVVHSRFARGYGLIGTAKLVQVPSKPGERIIELAKGEGWLSCQWHPECDWDSNKASEIVLDKFAKMIK